jgi:hypothetical protein
MTCPGKFGPGGMRDWTVTREVMRTNIRAGQHLSRLNIGVNTGVPLILGIAMSSLEIW